MNQTDTDWRTLLGKHWSLASDWRTLAGEFDLNFSDGEVIYKVMRADCPRDIVDLQIACLTHLAKYDIAVPRLIPTLAGEPLIEVADGSSTHLCWAISRLPGTVLADTQPLAQTLIEEIATALAALHTALADFDHPALARTMRWDSREALNVRDDATALSSHPLAETLHAIFANLTAPALESLQALPTQAIHNDLNEHNLFCHVLPNTAPQLAGIIDFGDMIAAPRVMDIANAAAYLMLQTDQPITTLNHFVAAYAVACPLNEAEVSLVWPLALTRMAVSAVHAHESAAGGDDDPYLQTSQAAVSRFLADYAATNTDFVEAGLRQATGLAPRHQTTRDWIVTHGHTAAPLFDRSLVDAPQLDLHIAGVDMPDNPIAPDLAQVAQRVAALDPDSTRGVLGRYREARLIYGADFFLAGDHQASTRRTFHIAIDVFLPAGTPVRAPLDSVVHSAEVCDREFDYGGLIVLKHTPADGVTFYTLYGHLQHNSAATLEVGQSIKRGEVFAHLGAEHENGGWPPHIHFQVGLTDAPGSDWPGVVEPEHLEAWLDVFPDPAPLLSLQPGSVSGREIAPADTEQRRHRHSPPNLRTSYDTPLQVVRGWRNLLFDECGRTYLDAYNNVPHVGHSHPRIRRAVDQQLRLLNTNTRYLQPIHAAYSEALVARMPESLSVCFLLSSGSEANELALRLARHATGSKETIALRAGYHGHTVTTIDISDYKFSGPGGDGQAEWVHIVDNPDTFRAGEDKDGAAFAAQIGDIVHTLEESGRKPGCFIAETFPSVGGQIVPPSDYLQHAYRHVREAGGVCIADEVQTGLGRLGEYFWGFEHQGVVPDIVVLGKPMGNGYPLAAVITTPDIAERFDSGMEFFATFGGASVACAAGLEVLRIIDDERLADNAAAVGGYLLNGLRSLSQRWPLLADVRGMGLFIGVEIADASRRPLPEETNYIVNRLRDHRVLIGSDGPDHNVLKIRPPLTFSREDADHLLTILDRVLAEAALAHCC